MKKGLAKAPLPPASEQIKFYKDRFQKAFAAWSEAIKRSKMEARQQITTALIQAAASFGYTCKNVDDDGNCFYHAVSDQLRRQLGLGIPHERLRELAVDHLVTHLDLYTDHETNMDKFVSDMSTPGAWADHLHMVVLSRALNVSFALIRSDNSSPTIHRRRSSNTTIYLGYEVGLHYQSLLPADIKLNEQLQNSVTTAPPDQEYPTFIGLAELQKYGHIVLPELEQDASASPEQKGSKDSKGEHDKDKSKASGKTEQPKTSYTSSSVKKIKEGLNRDPQFLLFMKTIGTIIRRSKQPVSGGIVQAEDKEEDEAKSKLMEQASAKPPTWKSSGELKFSRLVDHILSKRPGEQKFSDITSLETMRKKLKNPQGRKFKGDYNEDYFSFLGLGRVDNPIRKMSIAELEDKFSNKMCLLEQLSGIIKLHAERRVALFFYILVAYHGTRILPIQDHTEYQHGKGRNSTSGVKLTQGSHSSIFSGFIDDAALAIRFPEFRHKGQLRKRKNILTGTYFMDVLNATIELPWFVNDFDSRLEGKIKNPSPFRKKCLEIIHEVAKGNSIHPIEGLRQFLIEMQKTLDTILKEQPETENNSIYLNPEKEIPVEVRKRVVELIRQGTLMGKLLGDGTLNLEYINSLLIPDKLPQAIFGREKTSEDILRELQQQILNTPSTFLTLIVPDEILNGWVTKDIIKATELEKHPQFKNKDYQYALALFDYPVLHKLITPQQLFKFNFESLIQLSQYNIYELIQNYSLPFNEIANLGVANPLYLDLLEFISENGAENFHEFLEINVAELSPENLPIIFRVVHTLGIGLEEVVDQVDETYRTIVINRLNGQSHLLETEVRQEILPSREKPEQRDEKGGDGGLIKESQKQDDQADEEPCDKDPIKEACDEMFDELGNQATHDDALIQKTVGICLKLSYKADKYNGKFGNMEREGRIDQINACYRLRFCPLPVVDIGSGDPDMRASMMTAIVVPPPGFLNPSGVRLNNYWQEWAESGIAPTPPLTGKEEAADPSSISLSGSIAPSFDPPLEEDFSPSSVSSHRGRRKRKEQSVYERESLDLSSSFSSSSEVAKPKEKKPKTEEVTSQSPNSSSLLDSNSLSSSSLSDFPSLNFPIEINLRPSSSEAAEPKEKKPRITKEPVSQSSNTSGLFGSSDSPSRSSSDSNCSAGISPGSSNNPRLQSARLLPGVGGAAPSNSGSIASSSITPPTPKPSAQ